MFAINYHVYHLNLLSLGWVWWCMCGLVAVVLVQPCCSDFKILFASALLFAHITFAGVLMHASIQIWLLFSSSIMVAQWQSAATLPAIIHLQSLVYWHTSKSSVSGCTSITENTSNVQSFTPTEGRKSSLRILMKLRGRCWRNWYNISYVCDLGFPASRNGQISSLTPPPPPSINDMPLQSATFTERSSFVSTLRVSQLQGDKWITCVLTGPRSH